MYKHGNCGDVGIIISNATTNVSAGNKGGGEDRRLIYILNA